ncbi:MAG: V4R domain-containing protein [Candidatus Bathyarchaeia archaeon]
MGKEHKVKLDLDEGEATGFFMGLPERVIIMTPENFVSMTKTLTTTFRTAGFMMFYMMGEEKGRDDVKKAIDALREQGIVFTKRQILEAIIQQSRINGWGAANLHKYNERKGTVTIRVENNPLAMAWGKAEKPICYLLGGYWAGALSEALEREVRCTETKCMSKGDPYCEFVIEKEAQ